MGSQGKSLASNFLNFSMQSNWKYSVCYSPEANMCLVSAHPALLFSLVGITVEDTLGAITTQKYFTCIDSLVSHHNLMKKILFSCLFYE